LQQPVTMTQCVAVCCSVLQCVAVCCSVLQQPVTMTQCVAVCCSVLQCAAVCCSVLQCVAAARDQDMCPSVPQCNTRVEHLPLPFRHLFWVCRVTNVLQGVAGCCNVLQYVAL